MRMVEHETGFILDVVACGPGAEGVEVFRDPDTGHDYVLGPYRRLVPRSQLRWVRGYDPVAEPEDGACR